MAMEIVNGIPCFNCTDVDRAKKAGLNGGADATSGVAATGAQPPQATANSGVVTPIQETEQGDNRPLTEGDRGTVLNFAI